MSDYGVEWLREATRIHNDGTFEMCPEVLKYLLLTVPTY